MKTKAYFYIPMTEQKSASVVKTSDVGNQVIARVEELSQLGFTMPKDYNYVNAIKASILVLQDLKDKNGKAALEVCTPASIQQALFKMCTKGVSAANKTCYFLVRGNQLCCDDSYFGKVLQVKRIYPDWEPCPRVIYEDDDFVFTTDVKTGRRQLVRHEQTLANLNGDFVGAYLFLPCKDGGTDLYIMSKREIISAWSKSSSREHATHKAFPTKMIGKTIVNSGCNMIINSTPDASQLAVDDDFESAHTPIDIPTHEIVEVDPDEIPVAEEAVPKEIEPQKFDMSDDF